MLRMGILRQYQSNAVPSELCRYFVVDEVEQLNSDYDVILLSGDKAYCLESVKRLRGNNDTALVLIVTLADHGIPSTLTFDWQGIDSLSDAITKWSKRSRSIPTGVLNDPMTRVIAYSYVSDQHISALKDIRQLGWYSYPLLSVFTDQQIKADDLLLLMIKHGYVEPSELVDSFFGCEKCGSGHQKYSESCDQCHSIDIHHKPFLHCFACGYIAPEQDFFVQSKLICSQCHKHLRHFGDDYDHALENIVCHHCGSYSTEPDIVVECIDCGHKQATSDLCSRKVYHYALTAKAVAWCERSHDPLMMIISAENYLIQEEFKQMLRFQMRVHNRYQHIPFSVVRVLPDENTSLDELSKLVQNILSLIRDTDWITTTIRKDALMIMLTATNDTHAEGFIERLQAQTHTVEMTVMTSHDLTLLLAE